MVPKACLKIVDEINKNGAYVKDLLISEACKKCGKPIPFEKAKPFIEEAANVISGNVIKYIKNKVPKFPDSTINTQFILGITKAIEENFKHNKDLCIFDLNNKTHKKEIDKSKSIATEKALPKVMGLLSFAGECPKGTGIATDFLYNIPKNGKKIPNLNLNIKTYIEDISKRLCNTL